jgi:Ran GTPase-activating protein (RanGAP) involved in mRNA processing and transport
VLEDQREISDKVYLEEIRTGVVTYAELYCANSTVTMPSALKLADAISATNTLTVFNFGVKSQEPGALTVIFQALSRCQQLSHLYLDLKGKNTVTESDVDSLVQVIKGCVLLTVLDISYMQLAPDQQLKIIQACSQSQSINKVLFSDWKIDPKVIPALGHFLETSSTLKWVGLHGNSLTPSELSVLLKGLSKNKSPVLEGLILGCNPIGPIGLAALATYIQSNKVVIKNLDIGLTYLDESCADSLFLIISCNSELESMICSNNELGFHTLKKIAMAMKDNNHLLKLDLHANSFHGNQRLAVVTDMSEVPQSSAQLLQQIDVKISLNKQSQACQDQGSLPKL